MIKSKSTKEEMLSAFKFNQITAKEIHTPFSDFKIYFNDQLTAGDRKILCCMR